MNQLTGLTSGKTLKMLWSMINALQLIVHLPLFNVAMPANAMFLFSLIVEIVNFGMVSPAATGSEYFDSDEEESVESNFQQMNIF